VYRWMKAAAMGTANAGGGPRSPGWRKGKGNPFFARRDWARVYEGLANAEVCGVWIEEGGERGIVRVRLSGGKEIERVVEGLAYAVGRRGSLAYLDRALLREVLGSGVSARWITGRALREKVEGDMEVANGVFVIGSLTADSLVRHAYGGCVYAAGRIMGVKEKEIAHPMRRDVVCNGQISGQERLNGLENGRAHQDLHLDRRTIAESIDETVVQYSG